MAKYVVANLKKLINIFSEIKTELEKNPEKTINLSWEFSFRPKTLAQLGFFFSGIVGAIQVYFKEIYGEEYSKDIIKELLYAECSNKEQLISPNGKTIEITKRISMMSVQEMSEFIEKTLSFCEQYGIPLQPELRYLWINNLNPEYIAEVEETKFREKDESYLRHIRSQPCIVCGAYHEIEAHHMKTKELAGLGEKTPDYMAVSLCASCHRNYLGSDSHITTEKLKTLVPFIFQKLTEKQFGKLCYERYLKGRD